jgi:tetratricopeptide (TPR) repeat protein
MKAQIQKNGEPMTTPMRNTALVVTAAMLLLTLPTYGIDPTPTALPANPSAPYLSELAQLNVRFDYLPQAVAAFEGAIEKAETAEEKGRNAFSLAQVLIRLDDFTAATNALGVAAAAIPDDTQFLCKCRTYLAQALIRLGKPQDAEAPLRFVAENSANEWERKHARDQLFSLLVQTGRQDELLQYIQEQSGSDTNSPAVLLQLAAAYSFQTNGQAKALSLYRQVLTQDPTNKEALERALNQHRANGQFKDGLLLVQAAFENAEDPKQKTELAQRAATYARMSGDREAGLDWQRQVVELNQDSSASWLQLAEAYSASGKSTDAFSAYGKAIENARDANERDTFSMLLVEAQVRAGQADKAEVTMKRLAQAGATDEIKARSKRMLFNLYESQGRLDEIVFPAGNQPSTSEVNE